MSSSNDILWKVRLLNKAPMGTMVSHFGIPIGVVIASNDDGTSVISTSRDFNTQDTVQKAHTSDGVLVMNDRVPPQAPKVHVEPADPFLKKLDHARQKYSQTYEPTPKSIPPTYYTGNFVVSG